MLFQSVCHLTYVGHLAHGDATHANISPQQKYVLHLQLAKYVMVRATYVEKSAWAAPRCPRPRS